MTSGKLDFYELLGLPRNASQEDIKRAYLQAAQKLHPDKNTAAGETEMFLGAQEAFETLSNPKRRERYDATLPPERSVKVPYEYSLIYSRSSLSKMAEPQMLYAILDLQAPLDSRRSPGPPLNLCIAIDRSTSMKEEKMDIVKATAAQILRSLRPQDIISVVAFSDRAEVVIPAAYQQNRSRLEAQIQVIQPSGGTEIFQGLEAAAKEVLRSHDGKRVSHIILLTDGQTYGDEQQCLQLAAELGVRGVGLTAMGIGESWNDIFLDVLATRTGGSSAYIAEPQDIKHILLERFKELAQIYAEEAVLEVQPVEGIHLAYAFRLQPDPGMIPADEPILRLGPILQDASTRVILEFVVQPSSVDAAAVTILNTSLKVSVPTHPYPVPVVKLQLRRPVAETASETEPAPPEIVQALSRLMLYRMQDRARSEIESGDVEKGTRQLQMLAANLADRGERSLAQTILLEVENLKQGGAISGQGNKRIKYGTRALFLPPSV